MSLSKPFSSKGGLLLEFFVCRLSFEFVLLTINSKAAFFSLLIKLGNNVVNQIFSSELAINQDVCLT
jgi:hypothetical protein